MINKFNLTKVLKYSIALFTMLASQVAFIPAFANLVTHNKTSYLLQDLKIFKGYYQFEQEKETYVQILIKDDHLILKQLWDNKEIIFTRRSELQFDNNGPFTLVFSKNKSGEIISLLAFGKDLWNKVKTYQPVVKKEIKLSNAQLRDYEGRYVLKSNATDYFLNFSIEGKYLVAKEMWSGKEIIIVPESLDLFFGKNQRYPVKFRRNESGKVSEALIFNRDVWQKVVL